jgi:hypothetical protein
LTFKQKAFGACDAKFMKDGNYCLYTCGRCPSGSKSGGQEEKGEKKVRACGCAPRMDVSFTARNLFAV